MTDDGLPLPPAPVRKPSTPAPGANDLDVQMVREEFNKIANESNAATQKWGDKVGAAAAKGAPLRTPTFTGGGPGLLRPVDSELDGAMGVDPAHTGLADIVTSVAKGMGYMFAHPYTAIKDASMIARIKAAQQEFLADYAGPLTRMGEQMSAVTQSLGAVSDLLRSTNFLRGPLDQIMREKASCGDGAYADIVNALNNATDPDERAALQKQKDRADEFMRQRDARIDREKPTVDALGSRLSAMADEVARQQQAIENARRSPGPTNTTSGGRIIDSTHIRPEAVDYARELRDMLAASRARFDTAMSTAP